MKPTNSGPFAIKGGDLWIDGVWNNSGLFVPTHGMSSKRHLRWFIGFRNFAQGYILLFYDSRSEEPCFISDVRVSS